MAHIHYKFKSSLRQESVTFDGLSMSLADLKKAITHKMKLGGKSNEFDLDIRNAQTKQVYSDPTEMIPKNTSVVIARVPVSGVAKIKMEQERSSNSPKGPDPEEAQRLSLAQLTKTPDLLNAKASEEDKIKAMMAQSTRDYDATSYANIRTRPSGPPPPYYKCYRCGLAGHWIFNCPNKGGEQPVYRPTTGIPRDFLVTASADTKGARVDRMGQFVVHAVESQAYEKSSSPVPAPVAAEKYVPKELTCILCTDLLTDAVVTPCCGDSFCDDCIRTRLLQSEDHECPNCHATGSSPDALVPNKFLRIAVQNFLNETGYTTVKKQVPPSIQTAPPPQEVVPVQPVVQAPPTVHQNSVAASDVRPATPTSDEKPMVSVSVASSAPPVQQAAPPAQFTMRPSQPVVVSTSAPTHGTHVLSQYHAPRPRMYHPTAPMSGPPIMMNGPHVRPILPSGPPRVPFGAPVPMMNQQLMPHMRPPGPFPPSTGPLQGLPPRGPSMPPMGGPMMMPGPGGPPILPQVPFGTPAPFGAPPGAPGPGPLSEEQFYKEKARLLQQKLHEVAGSGSLSRNSDPMSDFARELLEYKNQQNKRLKSRSRSRSKSKPRSRSKSRSRSLPRRKTKSRTRSRSRSRSKKPLRSRSRTPRSRSRTPPPRKRIRSRSFSRSPKRRYSRSPAPVRRSRTPPPAYRRTPPYRGRSRSPYGRRSRSPYRREHSPEHRYRSPPPPSYRPHGNEYDDPRYSRPAYPSNDYYRREDPRYEHRDSRYEPRDFRYDPRDSRYDPRYADSHQNKDYYSRYPRGRSRSPPPPHPPEGWYHQGRSPLPPPGTSPSRRPRTPEIYGSEIDSRRRSPERERSRKEKDREYRDKKDKDKKKHSGSKERRESRPKKDKSKTENSGKENMPEKEGEGETVSHEVKIKQEKDRDSDSKSSKKVSSKSKGAKTDAEKSGGESSEDKKRRKSKEDTLDEPMQKKIKVEDETKKKTKTKKKKPDKTSTEKSEKKVKKKKMSSKTPLESESSDVKSETEIKMETDSEEKIKEAKEPQIADKVTNEISTKVERQDSLGAPPEIELVEITPEEEAMLIKAPELSKWEREESNSDTNISRRSSPVKEKHVETKKSLPKSVIESAEKVFASKALKAAVVPSVVSTVHKLSGRRVYIDNGHTNKNTSPERKVSSSVSSVQVTIKSPAEKKCFSEIRERESANIPNKGDLRNKLKLNRENKDKFKPVESRIKEDKETRIKLESKSETSIKNSKSPKVDDLVSTKSDSNLRKETENTKTSARLDDRKESIIDESKFEPDYDDNESEPSQAESESESDEESSSGSVSSSASSEPKKKKKKSKHRKHKHHKKHKKHKKKHKKHKDRK